MKYIEALAEYHPEPGDISLFLGGGITNCVNWQEAMVSLLADTDLVLLNPRRKHFPMDDPTASEQQIRWEYLHLAKANAIMFWFSWETLCPITLFEYGKFITGPKTLFVGCHPDYARKSDLLIQTDLARPSQKIHFSLEALADEVKGWRNSLGGLWGTRISPHSSTGRASDS